jgi:hypothetical protein
MTLTFMLMVYRLTHDELSRSEHSLWQHLNIIADKSSPHRNVKLARGVSVGCAPSSFVIHAFNLNT